MQNGLHIWKRSVIGLLVMLVMCMSSCEKDPTRYYPKSRQARDACWKHSHNLLRSIYPNNKQEYANRLASSGQIDYMQVTNRNQHEFWLWSGVADMGSPQCVEDGYYAYATDWYVVWYADPELISMDDPRIGVGEDFSAKRKLESHRGIFTVVSIIYYWKNGRPTPIEFWIGNHPGAPKGSREYAIKLLNSHNVKLGVPTPQLQQQ